MFALSELDPANTIYLSPYSPGVSEELFAVVGRCVVDNDDTRCWRKVIFCDNLWSNMMSCAKGNKKGYGFSAWPVEYFKDRGISWEVDTS